jgi:UDP-N-acetylmuramoylalanine--D-glutamate ligase
MNEFEFFGKNVSVIGAARSGVAVARLLQKNGAKVFVSDGAAAAKLADSVAQLQSDGIQFETGGHSERVYNCSLMVISPGVPNDAPVVLQAQKHSVRVASELEVASWFCSAPVVAITGSNGKTTTTTLTGRILADAKTKHVVAGNIGTAFSSVVLGLASSDVAVLEVSSFQLDHCESFRPRIAAILNITEDHMDRYGHSMDRYAASKAKVFMNMGSEDTLVYNADDPWTLKVLPHARCRTIAVSTKQTLSEGAFVEGDSVVSVFGGVRAKIIPTEDIFIKGKHNLYNAMTATVIAQLLGVEVASIRTTLKEFEGVEHRLEFVRELDGVRYYNDSKATNVDSVWYALQSFKEPIVLLLGGRDKGNDYSRLTELVKANVKAVIAIGESAGTVEEAFKRTTRIYRADSMEEAVSKATAVAASGDVVILSPACASFDWFTNYEHRGRVFKELVKKL